MSNEPTAAELAEAAAERAAIAAELAARNIPEELKEPKFVPTARAARAGSGRRKIGRVELTPELLAAAGSEPKRRNSHYFAERDYNRLELAELAAEAKRIERESARRAAAEAKRIRDLTRLATMVRTELPEAAAEAAARAGVSEQLDYAAQLAEAAAVLGGSEAEAAEVIRAAAAYRETDKPARPGVSKAGYGSALTPAKLAAVRNWTRAGLSTPAAEAGRAALAAIGPRAAGLVITNRAADTLTIARSVRVPSAAVATKRAAELAEALAEAETKLAAAEAASKAAAKRKAKRPAEAAEADANRLAAAVGKLAKRAELAARISEAAEALAGLELAELDAYLADPAARFPLAAAAEAAGVSLRIRADVMPVQYRYTGPNVSAARLVSGRGHYTMAASGISDPTGGAAAELADGYRAELARAEAAALALAERTAGEAAAAGAIRDREARAEAYKLRRAEAARVRRAEAAAARKMSGHNEARAAKRRNK